MTRLLYRCGFSHFEVLFYFGAVSSTDAFPLRWGTEYVWIALKFMGFLIFILVEYV